MATTTMTNEQATETGVHFGDVPHGGMLPCGERRYQFTEISEEPADVGCPGCRAELGRKGPDRIIDLSRQMYAPAG